LLPAGPRPGRPRSWQLTAALFRAIAGHEELAAALAELPPDRLPASLESAAITYLVRRDRPARLARYFPDPGGPQPPFASGFHALAMAFISERIADIMALCRDRLYGRPGAGTVAGSPTNLNTSGSRNLVMLVIWPPARPSTSKPAALAYRSPAACG